MLISKFDLYKTEWLNLVFDDRNKAYGAYELRQHYAKTMVRAMAITFSAVGVLCAATLLIKPVRPMRMIEVDNTPKIITVKPPVEAIKKPDVPKPIPAKPQQPAPVVQTTKFLPPVVTTEPVTTSPPKNDQITGAVGQTTTLGKTGISSEIP